MAISSKAKKEEAALRKVAKQARAARKEAAKRERKQRLAWQRSQQKEGGNGDNSLGAEAGSGKTLKKRGAIILPEELAELRQRLNLDGVNGEAGPEAPATKTKKDRTRGSTTRSPAKASAEKVLQQSPRTSSSPLGGSSNSKVQEPPHSMEVHHKRKQVRVEVTLHHVPSQHIDVSETTATTLVVDTCRHTKKYRLVLPMPEGLCIDPESAVYEVEYGVLRCVLPIMGEIPSALREQRQAMLEAFRKQKALRFHMGQDGELKVRTRRALLRKGEAAAAIAAAKKGTESNDGGAKIPVIASRKRGGENQRAEAEMGNSRDNRPAEGDDEEKEIEVNHGGEKKRIRKEQMIMGDETESADVAPQEQQPQKSSSPQQVNNKSNSARRKNAATSNAFEEERRKALAVAKTSGKAAQLTLLERIEQAKAAQERVRQRMLNRQNRREVQMARTQDSFARILQDQKLQLLERAERTTPIVRGSTGARGAAEGRRSDGKRVTFTEPVAADEK